MLEALSLIGSFGKLVPLLRFRLFLCYKLLERLLPAICCVEKDYVHAYPPHVALFVGKPRIC